MDCESGERIVRNTSSISFTTRSTMMCVFLPCVSLKSSIRVSLFRSLSSTGSVRLVGSRSALSAPPGSLNSSLCRLRRFGEVFRQCRQGFHDIVTRVSDTFDRSLNASHLSTDSRKWNDLQESTAECLTRLAQRGRRIPWSRLERYATTQSVVGPIVSVTRRSRTPFASVEPLCNRCLRRRSASV
jgi:hypothetical protein